MLETLIALLTALFGADHETVTGLQGLTPGDPAELNLDRENEDGTAAYTDEERERIVALANADADLIAAVEDALRAAAADDFTAADGEAVGRDRLLAIADSLDEVTWVDELHETAAAEADAEVNDLRGRILGGADEDEIPAELDGMTAEEITALHDATAAAADEGGDEDPEPEPEPEPEDEPAEGEPVLAGGARRNTRIGNVSARRHPRDRAARAPRAAAAAASSDPGWRLLNAVRDSEGSMHAVGEVVDTETLMDIAPVFARTFGGNVSALSKFPLAVQDIVHEESHTLGMSPQENGEKLQALRRQAQRDVQAGGLRALTASGGACGMPVPIFTIFGPVGVADRPLRDDLVTVDASRAAVTFRRGRQTADVIGAPNTDASGFRKWTNADDIAAAETPPGQTKPALRLECLDTVTERISSYPVRVIVPNLLVDYDPETFRDGVEHQEIAWARFMEQDLMAEIRADRTAALAASSTLGVSRDVLNMLDQLIAAIRDEQRLGDSYVLDGIAPRSMRNAIRSDLVQEQPGSTDERLATADGTIIDWMERRNFRFVWTMDDQLMSAVEDGEAVPSYPDEWTIEVAPPGAHVVLEGKSRDFGISRSPETNETNDAESFTETDEGHAFMGPFSYGVTIPNCISGHTAAPVDTECTY